MNPTRKMVIEHLGMNIEIDRTEHYYGNNISFHGDLVVFKYQEAFHHCSEDKKTALISENGKIQGFSALGHLDIVEPLYEKIDEVFPEFRGYSVELTYPDLVISLDR
ncbi:MAG: hypothetical protein AB4063_00030 [Crocosphaera sp.]